MDDNVEHSNEKIQILANKITTVNDLTVERASLKLVLTVQWRRAAFG